MIRPQTHTLNMIVLNANQIEIQFYVLLEQMITAFQCVIYSLSKMHLWKASIVINGVKFGRVEMKEQIETNENDTIIFNQSALV